MKPIISILLPFYNAQAFLTDCLESIQKQGFKDFEAILVDDGSTDDSLKIAQGFAHKDPRFKLIQMPINKGIEEAMNQGLQHCQGEWIARMDADDQMLEQRLEVQLKRAETNPNARIIGARIKLFNKAKPITPGQRAYVDWSNALLTHQDIGREIFVESPIFHPTFFVHHSVYEQLKGYRDIGWAEDYDFLLRAWEQGIKFDKVDEILVEKQDSPTRLSRTHQKYKREAMFQAKASFFARSPYASAKSKLAVIGTGQAGRILIDCLHKEAIHIDHCFDNREDFSSRSLKGIPTMPLLTQNAEQVFQEFHDYFFLLCVGSPDGLKLVRQLLTQSGLEEQRDFLRFV